MVNRMSSVRLFLESSWEKPTELPSSEEPETNMEEEEEENEGEAPVSELEPPSGGEESSDAASKEVQAAEEPTEGADQKPQIPKIKFRVRRSSWEQIKTTLKRITKKRDLTLYFLFLEKKSGG